MAFDLALDADDDLLITLDGVVVDADADNKLIGALLTQLPGQSGQYPTAGCGLSDFEDDALALEDIYLLVKGQVVADGGQLGPKDFLTGPDGQLYINGRY